VAASYLCLLLGAAVLHAAWNLLLKRSPGRDLLIFTALAASTLVFLPLLALRPAIGWLGWGIALVSAVVELAYFVLLLGAYGVGDFSVVYPVARGAAPALLAAWSVLFLGERPRAGGAAGIATIVAGLMLVGYRPVGSRARDLLRPARGAGLALGVALLVSVYSVIDGAAVRRVDPMAYTVAMFVWTTVLLLGLIARRHGWQRVLGAARAQPGTTVAVGLLQCVSYMAVLYVYSRAPVSYAGAIRESSIVLGALAGCGSARASACGGWPGRC
jgi:drug/metabolite transporter (DMT)-like permease